MLTCLLPDSVRNLLIIFSSNLKVIVDVFLVPTLNSISYGCRSFKICTTLKSFIYLPVAFLVFDMSKFVSFAPLTHIPIVFGLVGEDSFFLLVPLLVAMLIPLHLEAPLKHVLETNLLYL